MSKRLSFDTRLTRDLEREPSYRSRPRPIIPLTSASTLRTEMQRRAGLALKYGGPCSVCQSQDCTCVDDDECAVDHERVKQDPFWSGLHFVGIQQDFDDEGERADLELRNCFCGTTLARLAKTEAA